MYATSIKELSLVKYLVEQGANINKVSTKCLVKLNSLRNNRILAWSELIAFAAQMEKLVLDRLENNVGKGENAGYQHFLFFPHIVFERFLF